MLHRATNHDPEGGEEHGQDQWRLQVTALGTSRQRGPCRINPAELQLDFGPRGDYENTLPPKPPIEPGVALPPSEPPKSGG
jgi:hypothetical protein